MNIKDIAQLAGVSTATVSRVMNDSGYVSQMTREKVLRVIEEAGFVPSGIARSLSIRNTFSIGVIIPDIANEFFSGLIKGIQLLAAESNYNIVLFDSAESTDKEQDCLRIVEQQRLSGLLITPVEEKNDVTADYLMRLEKNGIPVVLIDRNIKNTTLDGVFIDNRGAARQAVEQIIEEGNQRVAIITGPETSSPGKERFKGYLQALKIHGIAVRDEYIVSGDFKIDKAYQQTETLLQLPEPPTAIFSSNNLTTLGVLKSLISRKYQIGHDIALISFDQVEALRIINYPLSTIERDVEMQGKEAMRLLVQKLENNTVMSTNKKLYIPYQIVLRGSEKNSFIG